MLGATPVFVDVDPRTFQIDPGASGAAHRRRCARAGQAAPARGDRRRSVRPAGGLAGACGDRRARGPVHPRRPRAELRRHAARQARSAAQADATATSFFPSKPLGAYGDGGALFTESDERAGAVSAACAPTARATTRYEVLRTGMNGRLDSMQAAVLLAKLTVFPEELQARERIARVYDQRLGNAVDHPGARARQHQRLGDLRDPAAGRRRTRPRAGGVAGGRRADRDLLSAPAASPAGLSRRSMTARRCRCRRIWRRASWRCRSIRI